ncbi:hypothetical protein BJY04DRAFT_216155 [Aspergillus karnatakaensis]|uniref:LysM peptidoglycan-binding domain-containing protein n=1 Tax=Aspergillus karnatakaensis TaxID=1810916 RepID=UPI003CCCBBF1
MRGLRTAVTSLLVLSAGAQQLARTRMFVDYPGLSDRCKEALATNVTCPPFLVVVFKTNLHLGEDEVNELCKGDCYTSLRNARANIEVACTLDTDVIVFEEVAYPATFITDHYLLTYDVSCQKTSAGAYCDPLFLSTDDPASSNATDSCSDCWLGALAAQLDNPLGYDEGLAEHFGSLTSSCSATGYSFASPTPYALNATATLCWESAPPISAQTCVEAYTVKEEDDCNSIAEAMNVSTYYLLEANNIDLQYQTFSDRVGKTLVVAGLDGVTLQQFRDWNPNFHSLYLDSHFFIGYEVCISPPVGYLDHSFDSDTPLSSPSSPSATDDGTATSNLGFIYTPPPLPPKTPESLTDCYKYDATYYDDTPCDFLALDHNVPFTDLVEWNPSLENDRVNCMLSPAYSYCVKKYENSTVPDNETMCLSVEATEDGTASNCNCFTYVNSYDEGEMTCEDLVDTFGITPRQLLAWNTWLLEGYCTTSLFANLADYTHRSVCVGVGSSSATVTPT